jgi:protease I
MENLEGLQVAVLAADGVEQAELTEPVNALRRAKADLTIIAPHGDEIQAMQHAEKGDRLRVDKSLSDAKPQRFDALVLPGGVASPDRLRVIAGAVEFVRHFVTSGKPIGAICHGPWTLIETGGVAGKKMDVMAVATN